MNPSGLRLRQIAWVVRDIEKSVSDFTRLLGLKVAHRDPAVELFGLQNALLPLNKTFIEMLTPIRENTTAGRYLHHRGGDSGYMVIFQTGDLEQKRRLVQKLGIRIAWEVNLGEAATIHLHPKDVGGALLSFDWMREWEEWSWAGMEWRSRKTADNRLDLIAVELQGADPSGMARRWSDLLEVALTLDARGRSGIPIGDQWIRFTPATDGRGGGVAAVDICTTHAETILAVARSMGAVDSAGIIRLGGTRLNLVPVE